MSDPDFDEKEPDRRQPLLIPRPWDMFEFHILGVPGKLLQPDEDYILWFRFEDARPADLLLGAVFLPAGTTLTEPVLPAAVGLPEVPAR